MKTNAKHLVPIGASASALLLAGGLFVTLSPRSSLARIQNPPPDTITLAGTVRDFRERGSTGGHPDFEVVPEGGFGHYSSNVKPLLGPDGKPDPTCHGWKVTQQWRDSGNRPICYALYDPDLGDSAGQQGLNSTGGIESTDTYNQWFNDIPGLNQSNILEITFVRQDNGTYVFDDKDDPFYAALGGFFPIDNNLFGNPGGTPDHNFHFTFELHTQFEYDATGEQFFQFIGDDDVWVFIDDRIVIDLGGVHGATEQYVDLSRLGLIGGQTYSLDFFFAERHRTASNFRAVTTLQLQSTGTPTVTASYD